MRKFVALALTLAAGAAFGQEIELPDTLPATVPMTRPATPDGTIDLSPKLDGTPIDFDISETPLKQALVQFGAATKMRIIVPDMGRRPGGPQTLNERPVRLGGKMPMWPGFVKMMQMAMDDEPSISWQMSTASEPSMNALAGRIFASKAFLVVGTKLERVADFQRKPEETEQFFLHLQVVSEPAIRIVSSPGVAVPKEAADSEGHLMIPAAASVSADATKQVVVERGYRRDWLLETKVQLTKPAAAADRIKLVKGTIPIGVVSKMQVLRLAKPGSTNITIDGVSMTLTYKTASAGGNTTDLVNAAFTWTKGDAETAKQIDERVRAAKIRLLDAEGHEFTQGGGGGGSGGNTRSMSVNFYRSNQFGGNGPLKLGPPAEAILEVPLETKIVDVEYEFKDLPMP